MPRDEAIVDCGMKSEGCTVVLGLRSARDRAAVGDTLERDGFSVVATPASATRLLEETQARRPDVAVIDLDLRGNALWAVAEITEADLAAVVVVIGPGSSGEFFAALAAGADSFVAAGADPLEVVAAVRAAAVGETVIPGRLARHLVEAFRDGTHRVEIPRSGDEAELSEREWEALQLLRQGHTTREIAERLFITPATVRSHVGAVCHKLGARSRAALLDLVAADEA